MKFTKKKDDASTIRKVYNDDKTICYGLVGKISDLLKEGVLDWSDYPGHLWLFLGINGSIPDRYGKPREEALEGLEKGVCA